MAAAATGQHATVQDDAVVLEALETLGTLAAGCDRPDLGERLAAAAAALRRASTVVAVVGQFKEGKSSLVNALVRTPVCPVDDDLATAAVTLVHHAETTRAVVRRRGEDGAPLAEIVDPATIGGFATEAGNPDNELGIERIDLGVPAALLAQGLAFVDTPGMGIIGSGHTAATLAFLPYADALLFVTDASTELTAPEIEFLHAARAVCPLVLCCLTKIDLYPAWRLIADLDRSHLADAGLDVPVVPLSARVGVLADERGDGRLREESGIPRLTARLVDEVAAAAAVRARDHAVTVALTAADQLGTTLADELQVLRDPTHVPRHAADLSRVEARLEHLRGPAASWQVTLNDGIADLTSSTNHALKAAVRKLLHDLDGELDGLRATEDWERLARDVQTRVATVVADLFGSTATHADELRDRLIALLAEEDLELPGVGEERPRLDLDALWATRVGTATDRSHGSDGRGMFVLGLLGRLLPGAAMGLLASNPVLLGAGALLGGTQLLDHRRRRVAQQRQTARASLRAYIDEVAFELGAQLTETVREHQRVLRDGVGAALAELQRTYAELATRTRDALALEATERDRRGPAIEERLATIAAVRQELGRL